MSSYKSYYYLQGGDLIVNSLPVLHTSDDGGTFSTDYMPLVPMTRSWEVERHKVTIDKTIGKGAFGHCSRHPKY